MPTYQYMAVSEDGIRKTGKMQGKNKNEIHSKLRSNLLYPIEIREESILNRDMKFPFLNSVRRKDIQLFCQHVSCFIKSGVPILTALQVEQRQIGNKVLKKNIHKVIDSIERGEALSFALSQHKEFPKILVHMIEAGEQSGNLGLFFHQMAVYFHKEVKFRQTIKKSITYPLMVSIISVFLVIFMLIYVVPTYVGIYKDTEMELPISTQLLIYSSEFIQTKWYLIIAFILTVGFMFYRTIKANKGKGRLYGIYLKIPVLGKLQIKIISARFAKVASILLKSGLPITTAIEIAAHVVEDEYIGKKLLKVKKMVSQGSRLSDCMREMKIFPHMVIYMMEIGEETGTLEENLQLAADFYDEEIELEMGQFIEILEPLIIGVLSIIVGFIAISMIQPIFNIYNGIYSL